MFQFRRFPSHTYTCVFSIRYMEMSPCGFPHSEICGSKCICHSPQLIAACHVLHRLLVPRHSPCALSSLTYSQALAWMVLELCGFSRTTKFVDTTHISYESYFPLLLSFCYIVQFSKYMFQSFDWWWAQMDSNHRPRAYQARALTT